MKLISQTFAPYVEIREVINMIIKKQNKEHVAPDLILTADWHLKDNQPPCRTDDFESEQWRKVQFISNLQKKYGCPIIHSGDLFDNWKPSPYLLSKALEYLPNRFYTIYGNHDLPQHNVELAEKCGINVLEKAGRLEVLPGAHWRQEPNTSLASKGRNVLVWHVMTYQGKSPYPGVENPSNGLIRKYKHFDLIVTGHNHQPFVEEYQGRILVNPGSITRQESDEADKKPCVWFWYAETNTVEKVPIPYTAGVVERPANVQKQEERNDRIDAFISKLDTNNLKDLNFKANVEQAIVTNKISKEVETIITKALES